MAQDRETFQRLAELRLREAESLLANGYPSGAYYLAGYAIELALKAKIAGEFQSNVIPDLKRVQNVHSHDLSALLGLASLTDELNREREDNPLLFGNWNIVRQWSAKARYEIWTHTIASDMVQAVAGNEGLLKWLQNRW